MPAAAVIPAPKAYIKVVAVKKLVVEIGESKCFSSLRIRITLGPYMSYLLLRCFIAFGL